MQTGPEGVGLGLGYAFRDLGKEDRNLYLLGMFADTPYRTFLLDYSEPGLFRDGDRLRFTAFYQLRSAAHFFGIGPDREMEDGAYYQRQNCLYAFTYALPLRDHFGMSAGIGYDRTVCRESELDTDDRGGFLDDEVVVWAVMKGFVPQFFMKPKKVLLQVHVENKGTLPVTLALLRLLGSKQEILKTRDLGEDVFESLGHSYSSHLKPQTYFLPSPRPVSSILPPGYPVR